MIVLVLTLYLLCLQLASIFGFAPYQAVSHVSRTRSKLGMIMEPREHIQAIEHLTSISSVQAWDSLLLSQATDVSAILQKAISRGRSGATAASVQVLSLMWLRTTLNYQYRYGMNTTTALTTLWNEGGIPRLYQGLPLALLQGPLSRFGDTAQCLGLAYIDPIDPTGIIPLFVRTAAGSVSAGAEACDSHRHPQNYFASEWTGRLRRA